MVASVTLLAELACVDVDTVASLVTNHNVHKAIGADDLSVRFIIEFLFTW